MRGIGYDYPAGFGSGFLSFGSGDLPSNPYRPVGVGGISTLGGTNTPYLSNFISSSAGASGTSIWDRIGGLVTNIGSAIANRNMQQPTVIENITGSAGVGDISTIPPAVPAPRGGGMQRIPPSVIVAGGTAAAGAIGGMLAPGLLGLGGGRHLRYAPPGTKGYHPIKKGPHAGMWARNRRMRVTNVKALRRGLRRLHGFEKICRRVIHFTSPRTRGRAVFKRRRRR